MFHVLMQLISFTNDGRVIKHHSVQSEQLSLQQVINIEPHLARTSNQLRDLIRSSSVELPHNAEEEVSAKHLEELASQIRNGKLKQVKQIGTGLDNGDYVIQLTFSRKTND